MYLRNKRAHQRKGVQASGWLADQAGEEWSAIKLLDISNGGFAFISLEQLEKLSTRCFRIQLPGSTRLMTFDGCVAYCVALTYEAGYRIGVQFHHVDVADLATIEWFVERENSAAR